MAVEAGGAGVCADGQMIPSETAKSEKRTLSGLGITAPHGVAAIVPTYLERFRPKGQFASYRT